MLFRVLTTSLFILTGSVAAAHAACSVPNTLTNGTTADATAVMGNFTSLAGCAAPLAGANFTGDVGVGTTLNTWSGGGFAGILQFGTGGVLASEGQATSFFATNSYYNSGYKYIGTGAANYFVQSNGVQSWAHAVSGTAGNTVSWIEDARIGTDGSFLVNTTTNGGWSGNANFAAYRNSSGYAISAYQQSSAGQGILVRVDQTASHLTDFYFGGSAVGSITSNGTATSYNTTSDERLKNWGVPQQDYSNVIRSLWVGDFRWKSGGASDFGYRAQQAYSLFPQAVRKPSNSKNSWEVDYGKTAALAIWGVKDLYKTTKDQGQEISALRNQVKLLKAQVQGFQQARAEESERAKRMEASIAALQRKSLVQTAGR